VDSIFLRQEPIDVVDTLAHECRHAYHYYLSPLIHYGTKAVDYVHDNHATPAERDAETFAKRISVERFGLADVIKHAGRKLESCPQDHRWFWQRYLSLDITTEIDVLKETRKLLFDNASKLKEEQEKLGKTFPQIQQAAACLPEEDRRQFLALASRP